MLLNKTYMLLFLCLFVLCATPAFSAAPGTSGATKKIPTDIQADTMEYSADAQQVVFTGNVHVTRPDFELWSKTLTVYFEPNKAQPANNSTDMQDMRTGDMEKIVAKGDVLMKSDGKEGRCQTATYHTKTDTFIMEGMPVLRDKENTIRGTTITHYMRNNQSRVSGKVKANFVTKESNDQSKGLQVQGN